jgi:steroid delta-isomerase-like uncharacterized protein
MMAWHAHDIDSAKLLLAPDFVYTTSAFASLGIKQLNKEDFLNRVWSATSNSFPDTSVDISNTVAAGDQVVLEVVENGTMKVDIQWPAGVILATNRFYSVPYVYFFKVDTKGLITSLRIVSDTWQFREQLGIPVGTMYPNSEAAKNVRTARRYVEGDPQEGRDNVDIWDEICAPDIVMKGGAGYGEIHGLEALKKTVAALHGAASRAVVIEETIAEEDRVTVRYTVTLVAKAPLTLPGGIAIPADKSLSMSGVSIIRLRDGKVVEEDAWADWQSVIRQLGEPEPDVSQINE